MLKRYHHMVGGTFRLVDATVIGAAWIASFFLRFNAPLIEVDLQKGFPAFETYAALLPLVMILWTLVFSTLKVYQPNRMLRRTHEVQLVIKAHAIAMLIFIALTFMFSEYVYSRVVMLYFGFLGCLGLIASRITLRNLLRSVRKQGFNLRKVLAVGEGAALDSLIWKLNRFPELGFKVVGIVTATDPEYQEIQKVPVLGRISDIPRFIVEKGIHEVLIVLPKHQYSEVDRVLSLIQDETIDIRLVPDVHEYITLGCEVEDFDGLPMVNLNESPLDGWGLVLKRITDVVFSSIALLLLSPLLILIGLFVKLTSRGPALFHQERMGLDGTTFQMLKFRTMKVDAEEKSGAVWARRDDDRKTKLGAFLRATSLDELPQFWNVLRGEMSLVGPRPERPVFVKKFRNEIPHYMLRHKVKAGITGWAQINGWRGNTSLDKRIEFDLYYIRNWSYMLDWKILMMSLWRGFVNKNAY